MCKSFLELQIALKQLEALSITVGKLFTALRPPLDSLLGFFFLADEMIKLGSSKSI